MPYWILWTRQNPVYSPHLWRQAKAYSLLLAVIIGGLFLIGVIR